MNIMEDTITASLAHEIGRRLLLVHHVPGRLRVRFDTSLMDHPQREALMHWMPDNPPFRLQDVNLWSHSAVINYDPEIISPHLVDELFTTQDSTRRKVILEMIKQLVE